MNSRRRIVAALAAALGLGLLPIPGGSTAAAAGPSDVIAVVIDGVGNGHGRGLSQWGAYGRAVEQGQTWVQILDHYYGGTSNSPSGAGDSVGVDPGRMTVRLVALDNLQTAVISRGPGVYANGVGPYGTIVAREKAGTNGVYQVWGTAGVGCPAASDPLVGWAPLGEMGGGPAGSVSVRFTTPGGDDAATAADNVLGACNSDGSVVHYRGSIYAANGTDGENRTVNDVPVEQYLRGVVPKEVSASWGSAGGGAGMNTLRAQAVAARSYALSEGLSNSSGRRYSYAKTCDTQSCQVYGGAGFRSIAGGSLAPREYATTDTAIADTAGVIRRWNPGTPRSGSVVATEFSASNGPRTAGGAFPPVDDPADAITNNLNHRWTRVLDADDLASRYGLGSVTSASMVEAAASQYQQYDGIWFNDIVLTGSNGTTKRMNAWDFRGEQGLLSPGFTVRVVTRDSIGTNVALIGDSVGESAKNEFLTLTDGTFASLGVDTLVSRFITKTPPSPSGVQVAAGVAMNLDLAIVELGYNPSTNMAADIDAMMNTLNQRGTKRVIWVNMADVKGNYAAANAALQQAVGRWPNLSIADWNAASAATGIERARWITSDGVHLTSTGQAQFALWLRQVAGGSVPGGGSYAPSTRRFQPNQRIELSVVGENVVGPDGVARAIPAGASAVALNITAVTPASPGFVTVWPCDVARPDASNLNFVAGGAVANSVIAPLGSSGKVCFYSNQATDFLVDITGWFSGATDTVTTFVGATPQRVVDTRNAIGGPKLRIPAGGTITIPLAGAAMALSDGTPTSVPVDATAVAVNVTAVLPSQAGFFTVWPCGAPMPVASNVNFTRGSVVANGVVTSLGAGGSVCLYSDQQSDVLVDVLGWFGGGAQPPFTGAVPSRLVDTRNAIGGPAGVVTPAAPKSVPVRGVTVNVNGVAQQVPADASAVALNVTLVEARAAGFATVWPCGSPMPEASNVNFGRGGTAANGVIAPIGADGSVCIFTSADSHLIVDISGWFTGGATPAFTGNIPRRLVDTRNNIGPAPI